MMASQEMSSSEAHAVTLLQRANRVVIKVGSSLLVDPEQGIKQDWLNSLADDIAGLSARGTMVLLVSSGAIALGRNVLGFPKRSLRLDESQAAAAVGQIELARAWSQALGRHQLVAAQVLLTLTDTEGQASRRSYLNARDTLSRLLTMNAVPVINENDTVATSEIRYGDNDRLAARVATMVDADMLVLLSDIDGLYTAPPGEDPDAKLIPVVNEITGEIESMAGAAGSELSRGGMVTKIEAGKIATNAGTAMIIASGKKQNPVLAIEQGGRSTLFLSRKKAASARKNWIAGQLATTGKITVDAGAAKALAKGKSLLPAGVSEASGSFQRGDAVAIHGMDGTLLGHGLIAYDAEEAKKIVGCQSEQIADLLGYESRTVLIHRDDMALTSNNDTSGDPA